MDNKKMGLTVIGQFFDRIHFPIKLEPFKQNLWR